MTATFVKDVSDNFHGTAVLYRLCPPYKGHEFAIASSINAREAIPVELQSIFTAFAELGRRLNAPEELVEGIEHTGDEVMLFPAGPDGSPREFDELAVVRNTRLHFDLFDKIGYKIVDE